MDLQEAIPKSIATVMKGTYVYVKTNIKTDLESRLETTLNLSMMLINI